MRQITLGSTGITVPQNAFGALPIQRTEKEEAVRILRAAYEGGMLYFDSARGYSDSEEKIGAAFGDTVFKTDREKIFIATKTHAKKPEDFVRDLDTSLRLLKSDYIDVYQFDQAEQAYAPDDGTGMYECMLRAKEEGKIRHISITAHKIEVAMKAAESGLYETMQFPFSYLSSEKELALVESCRAHNMGFIAMKGLAGGLITRADAIMAYMNQFDNVLPIWGIQRMRELEEWLAFMDQTPEMTDEIREFIEKEKQELAGDFCRGCGYCMPCPVGIQINTCARMSLLLRRSPSKRFLEEKMQAEMKKIENCLHCGRCARHCPYGLDTPNLLAKNYEDYKRVIAGEVSVG